MGRKRVQIELSSALAIGRELTTEGYGALMRLALFAAREDGALDDNDTRLARIVGVDTRVWKRLRRDLSQYWTERNGQLVGIGAQFLDCKRRPLTATTIARVRKRDGGRCRYCRSTTGPFEIDHIFPRSRGGSDHPNNLCVACIPCNRAKLDRTPEEMGWTL